MEKTKETEDKEDTEEERGELGFEARALISETFKSDKTDDEKVIAYR